MHVVPPYHLTQIWCLWLPLTYIIALIALCGLKMERRLTNQGYIIALIAPVPTKFDACGPPLPFDRNLMPVVPPYDLNNIWCLWSPLTILPKCDGCGLSFLFDPNLMPMVLPYDLTRIWCLWSPLDIWPKFDACGPPLPFDPNLTRVVPPYQLTEIWCLWSHLNIWAKFDACVPPLPFDPNLMPVVPLTYIIALIALCGLKMERRLSID